MRVWSLGVMLVCACNRPVLASEDDDGDDDSSEGDEQACEPIMQAGLVPSGFVECELTESIYRVSAENCIEPTPSTGQCNGSTYGTCATEDECVEQPYGSCLAVGPGCDCYYGCSSDADCAADEICMCAPVSHGSICIPALCRTDADCDGDMRCRLSTKHCELWGDVDLRMACSTPDDSCGGDVDCEDERPGTSYCISEGGPWSCEGGCPII